MLTPDVEDLQRIRDMALEQGLLQKAIELSELTDLSFIPNHLKAAQIQAAGK